MITAEVWEDVDETKKNVWYDVTAFNSGHSSICYMMELDTSHVFVKCNHNGDYIVTKRSKDMGHVRETLAVDNMEDAMSIALTVARMLST